MKTIEALIALQALNALGNSGAPVPLKFAYAAVRNRRKLGELAQVFEAKRKELIEQFGQKGEDGQVLTTKGAVVFADRAGFDAAIKPLEEIEVEDLELHKVALADFPENIDIAVMDALLLPMVKEDEAKS